MPASRELIFRWHACANVVENNSFKTITKSNQNILFLQRLICRNSFYNLHFLYLLDAISMKNFGNIYKHQIIGHALYFTTQDITGNSFIVIH